MYAILWLFIFCVTTIDISYALYNRATIVLWESNPIALWIIENYGIYHTICFRLLTLTTGFIILSCLPRKQKIRGAIITALIHVYLLILYILIAVQT